MSGNMSPRAWRWFRCSSSTPSTSISRTPEQDYANLAIDQTVSVKVDALGGAIASGKVRTLDARIDRDTRNILVRAEIANPAKKILPGMFANITLESGAPQKIVCVPRTAVAYSLYGDTVYVVAPDDAAKGFDGPLHLERRDVRLGETRQDRVVLLRRRRGRAKGRDPGPDQAPAQRARAHRSRCRDEAASGSSPRNKTENDSPWARLPTSSSVGRCWRPSSAC